MNHSVYFLGIGGTLIGNLAILARELGYKVSGSDGKIYPPMSDLLAQFDIEVFEGFNPNQLAVRPDTVVIGNANLPRGNEGLEFILNHGIPYQSGPEWLANNVLAGKHVFAVSGTHGKTTTTSILAWLLDQSELDPGFLVGGIPFNFERAARLGGGEYFVIEADEYDCSYFDRRAKFMHYKPRTLIINNLEFDHADIYEDLSAIQYQFEHLIRTIPETGRIIVPWQSPSINEVLSRGCWSPISHTLVNPRDDILSTAQGESSDLWVAKSKNQDGSEYSVWHNDGLIGDVKWNQIGDYNIHNALAAVAAANEVCNSHELLLQALRSFRGVRRRMELFAESENLKFYDDFAHHPTAIEKALNALRSQVGGQQIVAVIEPRSHTMQLGSHLDTLKTCCSAADEVHWFKGSNVAMDLDALVTSSSVPSSIHNDLDELVDTLCQESTSPTHVLLMSNGGFGGIYQKIKERVT